jgi:hypothetical protein
MSSKKTTPAAKKATENTTAKAPETPKKVPAKAPEKAPAPPKKAPEKFTRVLSLAQVINQYKGKTVTVSELITKADLLYVKHGGPSNEKETKFVTGYILGALEGLNLISRQPENVISVKAF